MEHNIKLLILFVR